ncbi:hypothetical protein ACETK8_07365 [Brevundimonas staleyi]|uniref:Uncharacterized protein n=1 Tax=Brevundimonas staleyi TaxID=74326 RepID=A0ABW0FQU5_9CAUL
MVAGPVAVISKDTLRGECALERASMFKAVLRLEHSKALKRDHPYDRQADAELAQIPGQQSIPH